MGSAENLKDQARVAEVAPMEHEATLQVVAGKFVQSAI